MIARSYQGRVTSSSNADTFYSLGLSGKAFNIFVRTILQSLCCTDPKNKGQTEENEIATL